MRFGDHDARLRDVLAGELGQVGGLLAGTAPVGEGRRDATGGQDRKGQAHVAVRQRLGDQGVGHRAAVSGDAVEVLGDVDGGDAEFGGLGDQVRGVRGGIVGIVCGGSQDLLGELTDRLEDQLLVLVGVQIEVVGATRTQTRRWLAEALHPLELTGGCAQRGERRLDAIAQPRLSGSRSPCLSRNSWPSSGVMSASPMSVADRLCRCRPTALSDPERLGR